MGHGVPSIHWLGYGVKSSLSSTSAPTSGWLGIIADSIARWGFQWWKGPRLPGGTDSTLGWVQDIGLQIEHGVGAPVVQWLRG